MHRFRFALFLFAITYVLANACRVFIYSLQGCSTGTGAIAWLPQCQWSNPEAYGSNWSLPSCHRSQTVCIILEMYQSSCSIVVVWWRHGHPGTLGVFTNGPRYMGIWSVEPIPDIKLQNTVCTCLVRNACVLLWIAYLRCVWYITNFA